jgi:hypothetical protein
MDPERSRPRESHCVLCISCASYVPPENDAAQGGCLAGADPRRALFECESYVRLMGRAPDVPARYRHPAR